MGSSMSITSAWRWSEWLRKGPCRLRDREGLAFAVDLTNRVENSDWGGLALALEAMTPISNIHPRTAASVTWGLCM